MSQWNGKIINCVEWSEMEKMKNVLISSPWNVANLFSIASIDWSSEGENGSNSSSKKRNKRIENKLKVFEWMMYLKVRNIACRNDGKNPIYIAVKVKGTQYPVKANLRTRQL